MANADDDHPVVPVDNRAKIARTRRWSGRQFCASTHLWSGYVRCGTVRSSPSVPWCNVTCKVSTASSAIVVVLDRGLPESVTEYVSACSSAVASPHARPEPRRAGACPARPARSLAPRAGFWPRLSRLHQSPEHGKNSARISQPTTPTPGQVGVTWLSRHNSRTRSSTTPRRPTAPSRSSLGCLRSLCRTSPTAMRTARPPSSGDSVSVGITCGFQLLTPVISSIVGSTVNVSASAVFPVKAGLSGTAGGLASTPTADFVGTPTSGSDPLTVQFTDLSTNVPLTWAWDFNSDGITDDNTQDPVHPFAIGGHTVSLTVTNGAGAEH